MAKPIKETPIIFGEDAKRFNQSIKDVKPASDDEKRRIKEAYENIKKIWCEHEISKVRRIRKDKTVWLRRRGFKQLVNDVEDDTIPMYYDLKELI